MALTLDNLSSGFLQIAKKGLRNHTTWALLHGVDRRWKQMFHAKRLCAIIHTWLHTLYAPSY